MKTAAASVDGQAAHPAGGVVVGTPAEDSEPAVHRRGPFRGRQRRLRPAPPASEIKDVACFANGRHGSGVGARLTWRCSPARGGRPSPRLPGQAHPNDVFRLRWLADWRSNAKVRSSSPRNTARTGTTIKANGRSYLPRSDRAAGQARAAGRRHPRVHRRGPDRGLLRDPGLRARACPTLTLKDPRVLQALHVETAHQLKGRAEWTRIPHPRGRQAAGGPARPLSVGFYVSWDESSRESLADHVDQLDVVSPQWIALRRLGRRHRRSPPTRRPRAIIAQAKKPPSILPGGAQRHRTASGTARWPTPCCSIPPPARR